MAQTCFKKIILGQLIEHEAIDEDFRSRRLPIGIAKSLVFLSRALAECIPTSFFYLCDIWSITLSGKTHFISALRVPTWIWSDSSLARL